MSIKKSTKIIIVAGILACILLCIVGYAYSFAVFSFPKNRSEDMAKERFNSFYSQPENSLDAVIIGSSSVDRYWIPSLAYQNYGIAVYGLSSGNQPAVFAKYLIKEVEKTQDVDVYLIDIRGMIRSSGSTKELDVRRVTDNLRMSPNRYNAVKAALDYLEQGETTKVNTDDRSYYIPQLKYYPELKEKGLIKEYIAEPRPESEFLGYFAYNSSTYKKSKQKPTATTSKTTEIAEANQEVLNDLLDYCDTLDAEVLFITSPQKVSKDRQQKYNYVFKVIEDRGYETINFNTSKMYKKLKWDFKNDLYNSGHANIWGAVKYTNYLGKYLQEKYELPDHRGYDSNKYTDFVEAHEALIEEVTEHNPKLEKLLD